jgi:hypothetical protein
MDKLKSPIAVEVEIQTPEGPVTLRATATHYRDADDDHVTPWIEEWTVVDEAGEPVHDGRGEDEIGRALDARMREVTCERCHAVEVEQHGTVRHVEESGDGMTHDGGCDRCCVCAAQPCECHCGCDAPSTTTDEGTALCDACSDYVIVEGEVYCWRDPRTERTAGGLRLKPPPPPPTDPAGEWACYWSTACDDSHVVSRHATREDAAQAVAAQDWPPPGDTTAYLCGYEVRVLLDGQWVPEDYDAV